MLSPDDLSLIRKQFPSLAVADSGKARIYLDNPAGTQTPAQVIDAMTSCLINANANLGGYFSSSLKAEKIVIDAHRAMAAFLNAQSPDEITFGQNMTTLTFHISRSLGRLLKPKDEIILTRMDHDANIAPWLMLADDLDLTIRWIDVDPSTYELDMSTYDAALNERTRLVAVGLASNTIGTVNDVKTISERARQFGALVYVDAVQYAPHRMIDVQDIGCDFLVCSPYKFFGPHQGVLWGRREILDQLTAYKVRAVSDGSPDQFETGTLSHESMAGVLGAVEYFSWFGKTFGGSQDDGSSDETFSRRDIAAAYAAMEQYENDLTGHFAAGLQAIPSVTIHGVTDPARLQWRLPTVSFTSSKLAPREIAERLAEDNIFVWDGHNYALEVIKRLGLMESGGVVRVGIAHYNTREEIDFLLQRLSSLV